MTAQIGPDYGTLEALQAFKVEVDTFYSQNYLAGEGSQAMVTKQYTGGEVVADSAYGGNLMYHVNKWQTVDHVAGTYRDFGSVDTLTIYRMVDVPIHTTRDRFVDDSE